MDTIEQTVGKNVKAYRIARGLTGRELGQRMGALCHKEGKAWPPQTVYMMESGERSFNIAELSALSRVLEVTLDDLTTGDWFRKQATPFEPNALLRAKLEEIAHEASKLLDIQHQTTS
ncbi:helix-turn-helix transcriptional regulator [Glutamicibacter protophormiae]|uniref:helix-turn-helix domain-containing protein n=1 Tax=Glutamicibacter protophormiae TaxID=37930 RepID=UPI002A7ED87B|nr:helix-turn-helix transcriptional regulator [Glutamicibacter protophormiae]WPR65240.1 helix-turn-helix transcriptional regulator [Glutamicibacter protophormiae]WPR68737.1 helix-turn-helix transcriptional regulator [Glutamicibacter protophormiae]